MKKLAVSLAAGLCALGAVTAAHADDVTFPGFAHGSQTVTYTVSSPNVAASATVNAGGFSTVLNGGPSFTSYCVDLYQTISFGTPYHDYVPVGGAHIFANSDAYADLSRLYAGFAATVTDAVHEAAFQIAVWEIAYETGDTYDLAHGAATFTGGTAASSGALSLASGWLAGLGQIRGGPAISVLESRGQQDVIYAPVPEPSEIMLMVTGLIAMGAFAKRRRKAKASAA